MAFKLADKHKMAAAIAISFAFFACELAVAFRTSSLALLADAFHYLNDLVSFVVTLTSIVISEKPEFRQDFSFGWQRARLLGAFFNGSFLLALGISIFLQSIERFIAVKEIDNVKMVLITGCVGLGLNIITAAFLHDHDQSECRVEKRSASEFHANHRHVSHSLKAPGRELGMMGALLHVVGDAINNIGVIIAALIIWFTSSPSRFYADPAVGLGISFMILFSALPLVKHSGEILLQSAPRGVFLSDIKHDIEKIPGIESVHELHVWRLDQKKAIASAHITVSDPDVSSFMAKAKTIRECLHAYGIHSTTLQPELPREPVPRDGAGGGDNGGAGGKRHAPCQIMCGKGLCDHLMCCNTLVQV
ncbi:uncharacterized protein THITE_2144300 [Thermothielavioides terrestris NRRL 8126]|uniref:Cation efflux protein n=1 Tax=Thermothielavioides terrestris (strain ATCC 38088 / NRRL 8126) TaxID=578455 RepID=G2R3J5_THETT|nr:uncharacterized protein THITE_2144300 [Thermothielavioides terrestris NRRL 8126]AEO66805.1 hypothetical protein THITE_2144300 [Thermothielavioides terrestris NRRL 8126]